MGEQTGTAAGGAARAGLELGQAISAEGGHDGGSIGGASRRVQIWTFLKSVGFQWVGF